MANRLGYHTICWGGVIGDPVGVTSIKDLLYRSNGDLEQAIAEIAELGYEGFELFDGNLLDYEDRLDDFRSIVEAAGLEVIGVYVGGNFIFPEVLHEELWRVRRAAASAAAVGATHLVVGGGAQRSNGISPSDYELLADALDEVCEIAEHQGLSAVYHPHLTTIVESPDQVDRVMELSRIDLCADTAHLAAGGGDPASIIRQHANRLRYVHLKDLAREPFGFRPLGAGELDIAGIVKTLEEVGYQGWITVELDSYDGAPREAAASSKEFLSRILTRK